MSSVLKIEGLRELNKLLHELEKTVGQRAVTRAVAAASAPIVTAMKEACPVDEGGLKKSIGRRYKSYRKGGFTRYVVIGPRWPASHGHLTEYGWTDVNGKFHPGKGWARRVWDAQKNPALSTLQDVCWNEVKKASAI